MKPLFTSSAVERADRCPASTVLPAVRSENEFSARGTVGHRVLERASEVGPEEAIDELGEDEHLLREQMAELDYDALPVGASYAAEVAFALDIETRQAREIGRGLTREEAYAELSETEIGAIGDSVAIAPDHVYGADYKFGWSDRPVAAKNPQLKTLLAMAALAYDRPEAVGEIYRFPEAGSAWQSRARFDLFDIMAHVEFLVDLHVRVLHEQHQLKHGAPVRVSMGRWCKFCPALTSCPGQTSLLRRLATGELPTTLEAMTPLTHDNFADAWEKIDILGQLYKGLKSEATLFAKHHGPLPLNDGVSWVGEREKRGNERLDGNIAFRVIAEKRGVEVAQQSVDFTATKSKIRKAIRETRAEGETINGVTDDIFSEIRNRGGASRKKTYRVEVFERPKEIES